MSRPVEIAAQIRDRWSRRMDRMFLYLLVIEWVFAVGLALTISPWSYEGETRSLHMHVKAACLFGGLINVLPITLILTRPGWSGTRHSIAAVQMLWSAMLIMITGGRVETHFHIFGSLAFLALYRDWKILPTASLVVVADHLARGLWWPDSIYGASSPEWWRFLEHAGWVVFEDSFLICGCVFAARDIEAAGLRDASLEITSREVQQRTRELQDSIGRYRALVENTEAIPFEYDTSTGKLLYIAPQALRLLDFSIEDLENEQLLIDLVHVEDRERFLQHTAQIAADHSAPSIDYRMITKRGRAIQIRSFSSSQGDHRIGGIMFDVTRQRQLESELQQAQKLESIGRLAAGVAHEINTPIQFVGDSLEFVQASIADVMDIIHKQRAVVDSVLDGRASMDLARQAEARIVDADLPYLSEQLPAALERAVGGVERVTTIVRSMKMYAHPHRAAMVEVDLNRAIESTLTVARHEYRYVADVETDYGELPRVSCNAGEIDQVVLNIIVNAAHAIGEVVRNTPNRGTIGIKTRFEADHVIVTIADTGGGIPDHAQAQVFEPFFTTKPVGRGTGQGLAIARTVIVENHGGTLTFHSATGHGTTFVIRIPIRSHPSAKMSTAA
jgi:PAS domain S-box-containing protein